MARWIALALAVALAAGLPRATAAPRSAAPRVTVPEASAGIAIFDVRRHARTHDVVPPAVRRDPRYYVRPVYYRPYPYGVPAPFVFGYGPFW
ncbi:hypothetical protein A5906_12325 [Bradyrhizobium sacchari]|uniref:PXPV repeat-containing protein n=1 Tax=Bradyrhizobium sacchari TaxID=1399419 RepID=A0A560KEU8_9BRAD|nr:hypothetical protein [Bradyrhizobium sacchari]OPY94721.1 hypothetical protein A5906_12325 [Bradyrhizobium sacchari]TWB65509.1 hypothetical protein FBZ94_1021060 [Bradyrhizobium sacchari]TWB81833.1 hypothetical protein FBZ95_1021061 [Bradyrhizobium sacchari]